MKQVWKRLLAGILTAALLIAVLPGQALAALLENSRSQNEYILEQLQELWGDDVTAEQALALLRQYGLVDSQGNVVTDWSDELYLEEDPQPLTLAEAAALEDGAVTVNGHAAQARDVAEALARLEGLGLFAGGALAADWQLTVDGTPTAPADYAAARSSWEAPEDETGGEGEGILASVGRALGLTGPEGPAVTVLGAEVSDPDALEDLIARLDQWGVLTETGALTDWALTVPGQRRQVTPEELAALAEAGEADDDTVVLVGETPISLGDLRVLLDIEAELRRIEDTYFQEEVELTQEQAESLVSIYEQLLADGGFTLYNVNAADNLHYTDFPSGNDRSSEIEVLSVGSIMNSELSVQMEWTASYGGYQTPVSMSYRVLSGSVGTPLAEGTIKFGSVTNPIFKIPLAIADLKPLPSDGAGYYYVQFYDLQNAVFKNTGTDSCTVLASLEEFYMPDIGAYEGTVTATGQTSTSTDPLGRFDRYAWWDNASYIPEDRNIGGNYTEYINNLENYFAETTHSTVDEMERNTITVQSPAGLQEGEYEVTFDVSGDFYIPSAGATLLKCPEKKCGGSGPCMFPISIF